MPAFDGLSLGVPGAGVHDDNESVSSDGSAWSAEERQDKYLEVCNRVEMWMDQTMDGLADLFCWKDGMMVLKAVPTNMLTRLAIVTSKLCRSKQHLQRDVLELLDLSRSFSAGLLLDTEIVSLKSALDRKKNELQGESMRLSEMDLKYRAAMRQIVFDKSERLAFRWYRLTSSMKSKDKARRFKLQIKELTQRNRSLSMISENLKTRLNAYEASSGRGKAVVVSEGTEMWPRPSTQPMPRVSNVDQLGSLVVPKAGSPPSESRTSSSMAHSKQVEFLHNIYEDRVRQLEDAIHGKSARSSQHRNTKPPVGNNLTFLNRMHDIQENDSHKWADRKAELVTAEMEKLGSQMHALKHPLSSATAEAKLFDASASSIRGGPIAVGTGAYMPAPPSASARRFARGSGGGASTARAPTVHASSRTGYRNSKRSGNLLQSGPPADSTLTAMDYSQQADMFSRVSGGGARGSTLV